MAKRRKAPRTKPREGRPGKSRDAFVTIARLSLALGILCVGFTVDPSADQSFDAPKRLTTLLAVGLAAASLAFSRASFFSGRRTTALQRLAAMLFAGSMAWGLLSALLSPRREIALDSMRTVFLFALLLLLGASPVLEGKRRWILFVFLAVLLVNAVISILQARHLYQPFSLHVSAGSRESTGAYIGNVGYLAQALALGCVAAVGIFLAGRGRNSRIAAATVAILFFAALLGNRTLTSFTALLAGVVLLVLLTFRSRAFLPAAILAALVLAVVVGYRPMRVRVRVAMHAARVGSWNRLLTYRVGAWRAATLMTRERPLVGFGPGTFGSEYVTHRLWAEIASRRRYLNPLHTSSFSETHCDYLQPFAEAGIPAGAALLGSVFCLFVGLARVMRRSEGEFRTEAVFLLALLGAGATAALTWFPMQRPITAFPLLLAAGRAWSIAGEEVVDDDPKSRGSLLPPFPRSPAARLLAGAAATILLFLLVKPEIPRYRSERVLGVGTQRLMVIITRPAELSDPQLELELLATQFVAAAPGLPGDPRPYFKAGAARLARGQPELAIENYRKALALGERAETDLNLGRAYEALGGRARANAAFLRAVWISTPLLRALLPNLRRPLHQELQRLTKELRAGRLRRPPELP